jgi:hypothetical protein
MTLPGSRPVAGHGADGNCPCHPLEARTVLVQADGIADEALARIAPVLVADAVIEVTVAESCGG